MQFEFELKESLIPRDNFSSGVSQASVKQYVLIYREWVQVTQVSHCLGIYSRFLLPSYRVTIFLICDLKSSSTHGRRKSSRHGYQRLGMVHHSWGAQVHATTPARTYPSLGTSSQTKHNFICFILFIVGNQRSSDSCFCHV